MPKLTLLYIGIGALLYYYFILRRFNTLGFRLFSLFTFITIAFICWIYSDEQALHSIQKNGQHLQATVISKRQAKIKGSSTDDNAILVSIFEQAKNTEMETYDYISVEEWNTIQIGQTVETILDTNTHKLYLQVSLNRFINDKWILYVVAAIFFLIGLCCWVFLRKYKVKVDKTTGDEWIEGKDGKVYLDERNNKTAKTIKKANIISKLLQIFGK